MRLEADSLSAISPSAYDVYTSWLRWSLCIANCSQRAEAYLAGASIVVVREIALSSSYVQMFVRVVDVTPTELYWNDRTMK